MYIYIYIYPHLETVAPRAAHVEGVGLTPSPCAQAHLDRAAAAVRIEQRQRLTALLGEGARPLVPEGARAMVSERAQAQISEGVIPEGARAAIPVGVRPVAAAPTAPVRAVPAGDGAGGRR